MNVVTINIHHVTVNKYWSSVNMHFQHTCCYTELPSQTVAGWTEMVCSQWQTSDSCARLTRGPQDGHVDDYWPSSSRSQTPDKYISVQPKEKREESLEIKCTIEGFRGRGGAENILLLKQITILCTGYIHVCIVRFDLGWGRREQGLTLDYIAIKIVLLKWISTKIQLTPKATQSGFWLRRDDW